MAQGPPDVCCAVDEGGTGHVAADSPERAAPAKLSLDEVVQQVQQRLTASGLPINGRCFGRKEPIVSIQQLWRRVAAAVRTKAESAAAGSDTLGKEAWYAGGASYWSGIKPDLEGVLGGFGSTSGADCRESLQLLDRLRVALRGLRWRRALDLGAGIGRVTEGVLGKRFERVDLVEGDGRMCAEARRRLASLPAAGDVLERQMATYTPHPDSYDCVWCQYCVGYLADDDFVAAFRSYRAALTAGGVVVVKENHVGPEAFFLDEDDNSVLRADHYYRCLFELAGLRVVHFVDQKEWPEGMLPVRTWVLQADPDFEP